MSYISVLELTRQVEILTDRISKLEQFIVEKPVEPDHLLVAVDEFIKGKDDDFSDPYPVDMLFDEFRVHRRRHGLPRVKITVILFTKLLGELGFSKKRARLQCVGEKVSGSPKITMVYKS